MIVGGKKLKIIPAHYLHASANHVYDPEAKVLFCGDVGAALLPAGHSNGVVAGLLQCTVDACMRDLGLSSVSGPRSSVDASL